MQSTIHQVRQRSAEYGSKLQKTINEVITYF